MEGYIKLYRELLDWEWFTDANTLKVWIYCLLRARFTDGRYKGTEVPRGSFTTDLQSMADDLNMPIQNLRTAIQHLVQSGEITKKSTNKFTTITVEKYDDYQDEQQTTNKQLTNNQQTTNKQLTSIKERKNVNNETSSYYGQLWKPGMSLSELGDAICEKTGMKKLAMEEIKNWRA